MSVRIVEYSTIGIELELAWLVLLKVICDRQLGKDHRSLLKDSKALAYIKENQMKLIPS